jgi:5'-nucleotidase
MNVAAAIDWSQIDTVLLDMDGTLLDLHFDNWFWLELIPSRYGAANRMNAIDAWEAIKPKFVAARGSIEWYCIDYWSRELGLDIARLKRDALQHIEYLPGAEGFLRQLQESGKRRVLVTNAHPVTLAIKNERVGIAAHFDACYSTHSFGTVKESADFWPRLVEKEPFALERTLFVDDSLPVLRAAELFGIAWLRAIRLPDSARPAQDTQQYVGIDRVADLLPITSPVPQHRD